MNTTVKKKQTSPVIELNAGLYAIIMLLSACWMAMTFWDAGRDYTAMIVGLLVVVMLVTRVWLVGLVYFGALSFLFVDEPRVGLTMSDFDGNSLVFAASVVAFLISSSRYLALTAPILPYRSLSLKDLFCDSVQFLSSLFETEKTGSAPSARPRVPARLEARHKSTMRIDEFLTGVIRWLIALAGASLLLQFVPDGGVAAIQWSGLQSAGLRAATVAWMLVGLVAVAGLLLTPIAWMRHSKLEAGVYLRSTVTKWCFGDLRGIVKRLVKYRRKSLVTNLRRGKPKRVRLRDSEGGVVRAGKPKKRHGRKKA